MDPARALHILLIEDDADARANLRDILELDNHRVATAASAAEALNRTNWAAYSAIILDRRLPDASADELLPKLKRLAPQAAVIIVTGYSDLQGVVAALRQGAADYILKPLNADALRASLERVAERQRLAVAKERSESAFRNLVEAAECMIVILRADGTIAYFSRFAEQLTGYSAAEVRGQSYVALFVPEASRLTMTREIDRVLHAGSPTRGMETPVVCRDGSTRWIVWNARYLPDYDGAPAVLAVSQDITSLKQAQERALQSERLAAIGQMVAGLAHESRNALQRSQACLEMLGLRLHDRPDELNLIERIQKAQDHLHHLYEDVREYAAPIRLDRKACDLKLVWREAWSHLERQRLDRQATLVEQTDGLDLHCTADPFRLEQVFRNLLDNALAACGDRVQIEIACDETVVDGRPGLAVRLRDNGPGIAPEDRQKIFEPFYTTKTKGTGLGMAIARRILQAHGGRIGVADRTGPGAEIVLTLPRDQP